MVVGDDQLASYVDGARQHAAADLPRLVRSFEGRVTDEQARLHRGEPDAIIPEFVVAEGVDLMVMGTVARSGLAGLLIGTTAERVLRKLPCSVLTVKPDGFVSPICPRSVLSVTGRGYRRRGEPPADATRSSRCRRSHRQRDGRSGIPAGVMGPP